MNMTENDKTSTDRRGNEDTIVAVSTPAGTGGIAIVRLSGPDALKIADSCWRGKKLTSCRSHTAHFGNLTDESGTTIDQCVATLFLGPNSFTGEDTVELSIHGSTWIQKRAVDRLTEAGARPAGPGDFSMRAFRNGRIDLAQAEGIADLIGASSAAAHRLAISQANGSFSHEINALRERLIKFAAMLELELDFSEEDVEFADRSELRELSLQTLAKIQGLAATFREGRAFKEGVPVTITGIPNAGKSTLLNRILLDDKAIVSDIPGTTRDLIEDTREIGGILFRFTDTAGLRQTADVIESKGVEKARERILNSSIILALIDPTAPSDPQRREFKGIASRLSPDQHLIAVMTKQDLTAGNTLKLNLEEILGQEDMNKAEAICQLSALAGEGIEELEGTLVEIAKKEHNPDTELIVTNARHADSLARAAVALTRAMEALDANLSADLIAQDVRESIHHLSELTGSIAAPELLTHIFSHFCIGK